MPSRSEAFEILLGVCREGALTLTSAEEYGLEELHLKDVVDFGIPLNAALNPFGRDVRIAFADVDDGGEDWAGVF